MKNKLLLGALLIGIASLFTGCKNDRDYNPTFKTPTTFVLNDPVMAQMHIQLTETNSVYLTWSQPDYGYNANATYRVQVGIAQADGSVKWCEKDVKDAAGNVIGKEPSYLGSTYTKCDAYINGEEIAMALNQIDGFKDTDSYKDMGFRKIAFRLNSVLMEALTNEVSGTSINSNTVYFDYMAAYCAIKSPAYIYLIGSCSGWKEPAEANRDYLADWRLFETEVGNNYYVGTFDIEAGDLQFRFYTKLTGWDKGDSWGPQEADAGVEVAFDGNGVFEGTIDGNDALNPGKYPKGYKGTWLFKGYAGGTVTMTVDMNTKKVKFETK